MIEREQHDDHCWIHFHGVGRKIERMNTARWIVTRTRLGAPAIVDLSRLRVDEYVEAWSVMQDAAFPGWR